MLFELRVANHRSLRDEQALTMEAQSNGADDGLPRRVGGHNAPLLPVAALYGANASGKSNVASAIDFMRDAVLYSYRRWPPEGGVPRAPFAWGPPREQPSVFEVTAIVEGTKLAYGFAANDDELLEEWLYAWPRARKQVWFERDGLSMTFGDALRGDKKLVAGLMRPNALFLSTAAQSGHPQLTSVYFWFRSLRRGLPPPGGQAPRPGKPAAHARAAPCCGRRSRGHLIGRGGGHAAG